MFLYELEHFSRKNGLKREKTPYFFFLFLSEMLESIAITIMS